MSYTYSEEHGDIVNEYLDRGHDLKERLLSEGLPPEEFEVKLSEYLSYARARIPREYWGAALKPRVSRSILTELTRYTSSASKTCSYGLGLTLLGVRPVYKLQPLFVVARQLVGKEFSCFVVAYDELIFWVREARDNITLKRELDERFGVDFFFLVEIPDNDNLSATLRQDLLARLELRRSRQQPTILAVNSSLISLNDILVNSFLGRLVLPLSDVNKPLVIEDLGDADSLFEDAWRHLDDAG